MNKPTYEELENHIEILKNETIEGLKKTNNLYTDLVNSIPKMFKIIELIFTKMEKP